MTNYYSVTAIKVGVCYKDRAWAVEQIKKMASLIGEDAIAVQRDLYVELKDGSYIKGVPCTDSARGHKFHKLYVQRGVDENVINTILRPCIMPIRPIQIEDIDNETGTTYYRWV